MKICFIWIKKFRNFENFGFNLSSTEKFKYDLENNYISTKKVDELPIGFFGERISDIVGLIGKNGAGKSNAIALLCKSLKDSKSAFKSSFFIITESEGEFTCHYSNFEKSPPKSDISIKFKEHTGSINPLKVVFFSNVFDERRNDFGKDVSDISVNNLFSKRYMFSKSQTSDFEKQIKLIDSKHFKDLNIDLPTKVQLTSKVWRNRFNTSMERRFYQDSYEVVKEFNKIFRDRLRDIRPENKFIHLLRYGFFFELIHDSARPHRNKDTSHYFNIEILGEFLSDLFNQRTENITEQLLDFIERELRFNRQEKLPLYFNKKDKKRELSIYEKLKSQLKFLKELYYLPEMLNLEYNIEGSRNRGSEFFTFDYNNPKAIRFVNEFISLFEDTNIFDINWLGISSGHKAYLNLFASIFQELRYTRQNNLLLCIDEGDLYLHPKWQIEFLDKLLEVLPTIFSGKIQLVLTSHSPFLLSDLPNQSITILDKDYQNASLDGIELKTNTFGGNLYDLYSEPFFLGNKRTSDFAYNKIKGVINKLESTELSEKEKIDIQKISKILGDEIIQFRINKILNND